MTKRVVVTGMSGITALGADWLAIEARFREGKNAVVTMDEWDCYKGLNTRLAAPINDFEMPKNYPRKKTRAMGRVSKMAVVATEAALTDAGLLADPILESGQVGVAYGSSTGSTDAIKDFGAMLIENNTGKITSSTYIKMMGHTTAVNISLFFGLRGRVITTSSACTSGSQGIGYAYEAIKYGKQTIMVAGGAEELCPTESAVFDTLYATSIANDAPHSTPRPFDRQRDGLVIGEGAGTLILEEYQHAKDRGATIYAEVLGFATNCDAAHITQPRQETMQIAMEQALQDADISADSIGYICAHGTATDKGDIAESQATAAVFGKRTPLSSLKSYLGHTLGACGALESWFSISMMQSGWFAPTINLGQIDPLCGDIDYITGGGRDIDCDTVMNNNFAFGGINTSLIFGKVKD
ncbi:3-oxoacyl-[acyl-carrier-protein] synthase 2 [Sinobacterium norvegicum]|uniref:3-oxoacyl-[acyl-carrier-protein] synthase 2 n=1 Tax=Sinobacterium norvegicum TaxID=1641715 RepID=A0ABN8EKW7_9GAMM|nr:beta-ketoacyl-ACP synthase [Sinobacterium norvegicum]CAH0991507.1 3-oxoacyl-[acyl-carrier-protein] synthase 2 [Sinobacterium norvegicum]